MASNSKATNSFWKSQQFVEKDPFAPIPASVYEDAEKKAAQWAPLPTQFSGVIVHDCSEHVPYGTVLIENLHSLVNQCTPGHPEPRYIAVGKGDLDRYAQVLAANAKYTSEPGFLAKDPYYFKGIPVREHDHRAGYYLLVCY